MQVLAAKQVHEGGAMLASSIRELAADARKVISGAGNAYETAALLRRIDELEDGCEITATAPIRSWLTNLRQQLQGL